MIERQQKTWGQRTKIFENDLCEVCLLQLVPKQRCSWHSHKGKINQFYVIEGELGIKTEWGETILGPEEFFTIFPPDRHEFQTHEKPAKVIEVAFVKLDPEDIQREILGGPLGQLAGRFVDDTCTQQQELPDSCKPSFKDDLEKTK